MTDLPPLDRLAALIARTEERLNRSHELAQMISDTLLQARDASRWSREFLAQFHSAVMRYLSLIRSSGGVSGRAHCHEESRDAASAANHSSSRSAYRYSSHHLSSR